MSGPEKDIKLKLAWQTAFELRTCPDSETLHTPCPDEYLKKHLTICHVCRDKREMSPHERNAWKVMREKFAALDRKPVVVTKKKAGQIWTINRKFGGPLEDGRFVKPPAVLLLKTIESTSGWQVSQLYGDMHLMGDGDVALKEGFGFAQAWNCYSLKEDRFDLFLGEVKPEELKQVLVQSGTPHEPALRGSILSFFRTLEIEIGAYVALPSVAKLLEEWESSVQPVTVNSRLENMLGSFAEIFRKLDNFDIPDITNTVGDLLFGARESGLTAQLSMASGLTSYPVNIVSKKSDGEISIKTTYASITDDDWQDDGTYFISGKLDHEFPSGLHLLAWLSFNGEQIGEWVNQMAENSTYFNIVFRDVPKAAATLENVKFLLVSP